MSTSEFMNQYVAPQQPSATPAAAAPAGWYPDPHSSTPGAERWWDGLAWSQEFARAPQQEYVAPAGFQTPASAAAGDTSGKATIAMIVGALLLVARIYFMTRTDTTGQDSAYTTGAVVGTIVGTFLSGWLFAWGLTHRDANDQFTEEQMRPIAVGVSLATLALGFLL